MSFAGGVKTELCRTAINHKSCVQAEAYGVLLYCNTYTNNEIRIITESDAFAQRLPMLFRKAFKVSFDRLPTPEGKHIFLIEDPEKLSAVAHTYGGDSGIVSLHINYGMLEDNQSRAAFLRGAFLAGGSVTDPHKSYHLEMTTSHMSVSREMVALMRELDLEPKDAVRKGNHVTYFKQSDLIEDFLTTIGAPLSAMEVMNARAEKTLRGSVNRRVNCDAANLDKVVEAAMAQMEAIHQLQDQGKLAALPEKLQEAARLRMEHPEDTLLQLAQRCDPPASKSAFNHRLRKLVELSRQEA